MARPDTPNTGRTSNQRRGSSRPLHRGADPRPYPGAPTRTRPTHARSNSRRPRAQNASPAPTPATVWTPRTPLTSAKWPAPLVGQIVHAFSSPGDRVGLLPWPATAPTSAPERSPECESEHGREHDQALVTVVELDRISSLEHLTVPAMPVPTPHSVWTPEQEATPAPALDLLITSLHPRDCDDASSDRVAAHSAHRLRTGGILVVLTHSHQEHGELLDPTGRVVTAAQNADLLYLQHIVALHTPVRHGRLAEPTTPDASHPTTGFHRRVHSDLLVFAQPSTNGTN